MESAIYQKLQSQNFAFLRQNNKTAHQSSLGGIICLSWTFCRSAWSGVRRSGSLQRHWLSRSLNVLWAVGGTGLSCMFWIRAGTSSSVAPLNGDLYVIM